VRQCRTDASWRMVSRTQGIAEPRTKVHEICEILVSIRQTPNPDNFCLTVTKVCKISAVKNLCSRKSGTKFTKINTLNHKPNLAKQSACIALTIVWNIVERTAYRISSNRSLY